MKKEIHFTLTSHAETVITERGIPIAWVGRVLQSPVRTEPDRDDPELRHALAGIAEYGDRILRVIYNDTVNPWRVVTAFFDRSQKGKL